MATAHDTIPDLVDGRYHNLNIVILGASYAGLAAARRIYQEGLPELKIHNKQFSYRITIVSPSTHVYWNICAPRVIVSKTLISHEQSFIPVTECFKEFDADKFEFIQGTAIDLRTETSSIDIECPIPEDDVESNDDPFTSAAKELEAGTRLRTIKYHALIIATGSTAHSPLLSLRGPHENTISAIHDFQLRLPTAESVVVAGGGPSGIEIAGQIAYYFKHLSRKGGNRTSEVIGVDVHHDLEADLGHPTPTSPRKSMSPSKPMSPSKMFFSPGKKAQRRALYTKDILLLSATDRLLPHLNLKLGSRAQAQLESLGVRVILNINVESATVSAATGKTTLKLSNGASILSDIYIPATGVTPNTQFLPSDSSMLEQGFLATIADASGNSTMRVYVPPSGLSPDTVFVEEPTSTTPEDDYTGTRLPPSPSKSGRKIPTQPPAPPKAPFPKTPLPRIYAVGDCASYSHQCVLDVYAAQPILLQNLLLDLCAYQLTISNPYGGNKDEIYRLHRKSMAYKHDTRDNQLVPIGGRKPGGVGVLRGKRVPSLMVWALKGRRYTVDDARRVVADGVSPYPAQGGERRK